LSEFAILRQHNLATVEARLVAQHATVSGIPFRSSKFEDLDAESVVLRAGNTLPVGTVEFVRRAMEVAGIHEPTNFSYPACLDPFLHRRIKQMPIRALDARRFVKPTATKSFTGFVYDPRTAAAAMPAHEQEQVDALRSLPVDTMLWVADEVNWASEYRYYVLQGEIRGAGRYDDWADNAPEPDPAAVKQMVTAMNDSGAAPAAYSLDVGVLDTGETALVECNDAWALGYYRSTLSYRDYVAMLWARWKQLSACALA